LLVSPPTRTIPHRERAMNFLKLKA
jgi:hypothetical protein